MAQVIVTIKVMPDSPDADLDAILVAAKKEILLFGADFGKCDIEPIAFGLNALKIFIITDEANGGTDPLEEAFLKIDSVQSAEVTDCRRAIG